MKKILIGLGCVFLGAGLTLGFLKWRGADLTMLNPLVRNTPTVVKKKVGGLVGFLPTWMVGKTRLYGKEVDQLVFLGIEVKENGSLVWDLQSNKIHNSDYLKQKENIKRTGGKNILGIKLFEDEKIDALLASDEAKQRLIDEVADVVKTGGFDGVNVDFEYMNNPVRILDEDFGELMIRAKAAGWKEISVDGFANTIIKGSSEGLNKLLEKIDLMIVMAYDFHRPGSDYAGPVAPVKAEPGQRSISEILEKSVDFNLKKEKIIMAYPLYGYEWKTVGATFGSQTKVGTNGWTVQYKESVGFTGTSWNDDSMSPWMAFNQDEVVKRTVIVRRKKKVISETISQPHQVYFENENSLKIKIEMAKQAQMGGIGFWALGYEGMDSTLIGDLKKDAWE